MWYLVKGLCEIHNDHVGLSVVAIQCAVQIAYQIMEELNRNKVKVCTKTVNVSYLKLLVFFGKPHKP